jgi:hypothetical protein
MKVTCTSGMDISYNVLEVAADGVTPQDHAWLTLNKTSGGPLSAGQSDIVQFTVDSYNAATTGYVRFVPSCGTATSGAQPQVRNIEVVNSLVGGEPFISEYNGDINPTLNGACGPDCAFVLVQENDNLALGELVTDSAALDQKAWHIADDSLEATHAAYRTPDTASGFDTHNGYLGSTLVARIKVTSNTAAGNMLCINQSGGARNASRVEWGIPDPADGTKGLVRENARGATGQSNGAPLNDYTTIRIASGFGVNGNRTIKIYVNECLTPLPVPLEVISLFDLANGLGSRGQGYGFGMEGTGAVAGDVYFDYIAFTTAGMFAPGEEVATLGRPLGYCKNCPDPFADTDEDEDVDMDDFAVYQRCLGIGYSAPPYPPMPDECTCFDRNGDLRVDALFDLTAFSYCASGKNVRANKACD